MMRFKEFFKTTVGTKPQSESGEVKMAETNPAAQSIMNAFGGNKTPEPDPPPADVSQGSTPGNSLGSRIASGLKTMVGG